MLRSGRKQCEERRNEMRKHDKPGDDVPALTPAREIPSDLMRQVGLPDDDELHERQIAPQNDEGEKQARKLAQGLGVWRGRTYEGERRGGESERANLADEAETE